jgi:3-hydroxyisobutyrate dehydrogenase-like beta-hydroxyacid dehydrogenase
MIISTLEMLSETMTLADKTGVGSDRVLEWIKDFYPAPSAIGYGTKIVDNAFKADGGFTCVGGELYLSMSKDSDLILSSLRNERQERCYAYPKIGTIGRLSYAYRRKGN